MQKQNKLLPFLIINAPFYEHITSALYEGAKEVLEKRKIPFDVVKVPGALEIPAAIAFAENSAKHYSGYIALGCVIRGETYHFEVVCNESARAIMNLSIEKNLVIANGILTVENEAQALMRACKNKKNKGGQAAEAALAMLALKNLYGV